MMFKFSEKKKNKGFTLVELIVVIAILAILVGLLAPQYTKYVEKSRKSADVSNLENLVTGLKVAASDHEYNLGSSANNVEYTIEISEKGTTLFVKGAEDATQAAKALNEYAGTKFSESDTPGTYIDLKIKSDKWGASTVEHSEIGDDGNETKSSAKSAILATVTIDKDTDAVTVKYSNNVEQYSKNGKVGN